MPGIREAIEASGALVVYACNVATQPGETGGFDLADHVDALGAARRRPPRGHRPRQQPVRRARADRLAGRARAPAMAAGRRAAPRLVLDDLVDPGNAHHHDSERLATALIAAWEREGGHRRRPAVARAGRTA